jgi:ankyrin repeat protein
MHKFNKLYNKNKDPYKFKNISTIFFNAIKNNDLDKIFEMFYKNRLLLIDYDYLNQNILHHFVKKNLYEYLTELIKNGANLNQKNFQGQTPLHIACQKNHFECIVILLYEISNIFIKDNEKKIAFEYWKNENYIIQKHINNITYEIKNIYLFYNEYKIKYYDLNIKKSIINIFKKIGNIEPFFNIDHIYLEKNE